MRNTAANGVNGILIKTTITFWRSLEMPSINSKVELKIKLTRYCVLSAAAADNANANPNNISFTIKDTRLYVSVVTLSTRDKKNYQKFLAKDLKDQFIGINIKQEVRIKIQQINIDISSN